MVVGGGGADRVDSMAVEGVGVVEEQSSAPPPHIRNTPKLVGSHGALAAAARPIASVMRVCSGSMMPSSHKRA